MHERAAFLPFVKDKDEADREQEDNEKRKAKEREVNSTLPHRKRRRVDRIHGIEEFGDSKNEYDLQSPLPAISPTASYHSLNGFIPPQ